MFGRQLQCSPEEFEGFSRTLHLQIDPPKLQQRHGVLWLALYDPFQIGQRFPPSPLPREQPSMSLPCCCQVRFQPQGFAEVLECPAGVAKRLAQPQFEMTDGITRILSNVPVQIGETCLYPTKATVREPALAACTAVIRLYL